MTPSDRELIEWLATNVMGVELQWQQVYDVCEIVDDLGSVPWNPLTSHDDAAMLEAKVRERGPMIEERFVCVLYDIVLRDQGELLEVPFGHVAFAMAAARRAKPHQICEAIKAAWTTEAKETP